MRILQVNKYFRIRGGADRIYFQTQEVLSQHGHEVIPFASHGDDGDQESAYSLFFVDDLEAKGRSRLGDEALIAARGIYNVQARARLETLIRETRPQVAHVHNIHYQISPSIFHTLERHHIPVVMTLHDYRVVCPNGYLYTQGAVCERCKAGRFYNALLYRCLRGSWRASLLGGVAAYAHAALGIYRLVDRFITHSAFLRKKMIEFGFSTKRLVSLPIGLDVTSFLPRFGGDPYFVLFGYVTRQKGPHIAVEAIRRTKGGHLVIVGDGPLLALVKKQVEEGNVGRVSFTGFLSGARLWDLIRGSLAVIVPSIWYEVLGMVVLEAYAMGKPVLASRIGGMPEVVREGQTGLLVQPGDAEGLAQAMQSLLDNPLRVVEMGKAARQFVTENFSAERYYDGLISLYEEVNLAR